jgi:hypothetical protein
MRKISIFVICAVLAVSLTGCSREAGKQGVDEAPAPPPSFSAGESPQTPNPDKGATETEEPETVTETPVDESEQSATAAADGERQQGGGQTSGGQSPKPKAEPPAETPKPTQPPVSAEPPKTEPPSTPAPAPTPEPPKPKTAYDAPYDTAQICANARAYGESIGMTWSAPLTTGNCSWEAPIQTSEVLSGDRLRAAVESGIRRVKKLQADNGYQPGEYHFKLYLEPLGNGEYSLYFLMG